MGQLEGQTAIITGGGTGIGFTIARRFHQEGAFVVICGRTEDVLHQAAAELSPGAERVLPVRADITHEDNVRELVRQTVAQTGRIDILVNNAGAMRVNKPPQETSLEEFRLVIDTNVSGTFLVSREVGRVMISQRSGRIINISSMSGAVVNKYFHGGSYEISKAAVNMLTKTLATEWAAYNIKVNAIAPGYYGTQPNIDFFINDPELNRKIMDLVPMGKLGELEELARLALYLASPQVDYMSGSIITIDGGYTLW
jgi:NAD(P)-dependent dehydrogenase (short-subunit alcohol dehydrogenase family)